MNWTRQSGIRWLAATAVILMLLTFTVGDLWHHHENHPGPVCHTCQTLHMPALSVSTPDHVQAPAAIGWRVELRDIVNSLDSAIVHRPSRAPPSL